jgi:hypothetical protein
MIEMEAIISGKEIEVPNEVQDILKFDEKVLYAFQQAGIGGKVMGLESIFVTERRVIKMKPKTFGLRADIGDYLYKDMANVKLNKGLLRSGIRIQMRFMSEDVRIENIPKDGANKVFKAIQDGIAGMLGGGSTHSPDEKVPTSQIDVADQIKKLAELKDAGILTEEEFQAKKEQLLQI